MNGEREEDMEGGDCALIEEARDLVLLVLGRI